jgi:hypothetical protein
VGATFVSEWEDGNAVWRRLEEHTAGLIRTTLWLGTRTRLGQQRNLAERPETAELELNDGNASQVVTGIDRPLAVFIPNALDSDPTRGVSDYLGVVLGFLAINETETIGQANARLVGRKRLFVEGRFLNARGNFPTDDDVFRADASIAQDGGNGGAITPAEYTFESGELVGWLDHLVDLTMTMAGVSPVSVGRGDMGGARSGTALRLRMTHTLMEAAGTGRYFDRGPARPAAHGPAARRPRVPAAVLDAGRAAQRRARRRPAERRSRAGAGAADAPRRRGHQPARRGRAPAPGLVGAGDRGRGRADPG